MRSSLTTLMTIPLLAAGCTATVPPTASVVLSSPALQSFGSCEELLDYYRTAAGRLVGPYGLGGGYHGGGMDDMAGEEAAAAAGGDSAAGAASAADSAGGAPEHSGTNNQEEGVEEADIVKTDGRTIVTATGSAVRVVDVASERVVSTITLPGRGEQTSELLLQGSDLVVLSTQWQGGPVLESDLMPAFAPSRTLVTRVDLTDPSAPVTTGSFRVEGSYRSARLIDDTVRLVMVSEPPGLVFTYPADGSLTSEEEAETANKAIVAQSTIDDWVPHVQLLDASGEAVDTRQLLDCSDISRPRELSGLSTLSVLTLDLTDRDVEPTSGAGLVASGQTVYASTDRLIVATSPWDLWATGLWPFWDGGDVATDLHSFDISDPDRTAYRASGTVEGHLLNQFALDEQDGVVRVATTTDGNGSTSASQSSLVVLREDGEDLTVTGRVDGLGKTEQIRSVRYLSADLAAVVTFRQTDPLYLIDTADPAAPQVLGELKIPGYSAYLHPLGDGYLLGIGQDADEQTGETKGLQASLFDVRDARNPTRVSQLTWPDAYSPVEWDHRAFLSWQPTGQFFLPAEVYAEGKDEMFTGVLSGTRSDAALTMGPRASTAPAPGTWGEMALRTLVVGDDLWVLGHQSLHRLDLASLAAEAVIPLR